MVAGLSNVSFNSQAVQMNKSNKRVGFSSDSEYHNPVSKNTEMALACTGPIVLSAVVGALFGFGKKIIETCKDKAPEVAEKVEKAAKETKFSWKAAGIAGGLTALITIPAAIYNARVNSSMKKEHYNAFEGERKAATTIARGINSEAKDPENLDNAVNHYAKFNTAQKGNSVGFINMQ